MEKLYHISEASKLLGLTEKELNDLVEGKKINFVVSSMTKMIRQSTIDEILPNYRGIKQSDTFVFGAMHISEDGKTKETVEYVTVKIGGEGNKIENLTWVNPDKTK